MISSFNSILNLFVLFKFQIKLNTIQSAFFFNLGPLLKLNFLLKKNRFIKNISVKTHQNTKNVSTEASYHQINVNVDKVAIIWWRNTPTSSTAVRTLFQSMQHMVIDLFIVQFDLESLDFVDPLLVDFFTWHFFPLVFVIVGKFAANDAKKHRAKPTRTTRTSTTLCHKHLDQNRRRD